MEVLDENDIEVMDENDFEVVEPQALPQRIMSNMANAGQSIASPLISAGESAAPGLIESGIDTARGVGQGLVLGATDEIGGALSSLVERPMSYAIDKFQGVPDDIAGLPDSSNILERYRQSQQDIQKELETSQDRSPWLYGGGQIAGGMTSGSAISGALGIGKAAPGAARLADIARNEGKLKALGELGLRGAKTYGQALPVMLTEGALSSKEGGLTSMEEAGELGKDMAGSALFGLPAVFGMQAVSDVAAPMASAAAGGAKQRLQGIIDDTPLLRQMKVSYGYGTEGINPKAQSATLNTDLGAAKNLTELDNTRTSKLLDEVYAAKDKIGSEVSNSLNTAESMGRLVDIGQDTKDALSQVQALASKYPEIASNPRAAQIFSKISAGEGKVTPTEAKDLIDYMDAYIGKFKSATNVTPAEQGILSSLYQNRQKFSNTLKIAIPEYGQAAERYSQFMKLVPETITAGARPVGIKDEFFGTMNNQDQRLFDQLKRLNQGTTREGSATQPVRESFVNTIKGLKTFEQQEAERLAKGQISDSAFSRTAQEIEDEIKANSDDAVARGSMDALSPHTGVATTFAKVLTGTGETGRAMSLSSANIAGRVANKIGKSGQSNPISKIVSSIYRAPQETTLALSQKLKNVPGLEKYGKSLEEALNSSDSNRRNQVLFTIMQNPQARLFVNDETDDFSEEQQ
jgi:hypothetical protein